MIRYRLQRFSWESPSSSTLPRPALYPLEPLRLLDLEIRICLTLMAFGNFLSDLLPCARKIQPPASVAEYPRHCEHNLNVVGLIEIAEVVSGLSLGLHRVEAEHAEALASIRTAEIR